MKSSHVGAVTGQKVGICRYAGSGRESCEQSACYMRECTRRVASYGGRKPVRASVCRPVPRDCSGLADLLCEAATRLTCVWGQRFESRRGGILL